MTNKVRVHELAREFNVSSKEVLAALKEQDEFVKSASSTVEAPVARRLRESFGVPTVDSMPAEHGPSPAFQTRISWPNAKQEIQAVAVPSAARTQAIGKARVHELARELNVSSKELLAMLKEQGEFVKSASSTVEAPVARRLRESFAVRPTPPPQSYRSDTLMGEPSLRPPLPRPIQGRPRPVPRPTPKPRPRVPATPPSTQLVTASEAYALVGVSPETVRKWASRGYLQSKGKRGRAALYDRDDLLRVRNETRSRTIDPAVSSELYVPHSYYNRLITTNEVARLFDVAPSTVRSWVRRGHLKPARRGPHGWLFKIGLVLISASDRGEKSFRSRRFDYPD